MPLQATRTGYKRFYCHNSTEMDNTPIMGAKMPKQRYPRHCLNRLIGLIIQRMARDINSTNGAVSARAFAWFTGEGRDWVCIMGIDETTLRAWMARQ
jgi:hypothetical protein